MVKGASGARGFTNDRALRELISSFCNNIEAYTPPERILSCLQLYQQNLPKHVPGLLTIPKYGFPNNVRTDAIVQANFIVRERITQYR